MGVIAQYQLSVAGPSVVGGTGTTLKYFFSLPPLSLWNTSAVGVNSPVQSSQIGQVPSSTNASGQLQIYTQSGTPAGVNFVVGGTGEGKLLGQRFRVYMSGVASSDTIPTITPVVQINTGTIPSPSYATLLGGVASAALTANKPVAFSIAGDLMLEPSAANMSGFFKYTYAAAAAGTPLQTAVAEASITNPTGLVLANAQGNAGFGLVCGITFSVSSAANSASLYEFKVVQD
jgi:hypothetical protein